MQVYLTGPKNDRMIDRILEEFGFTIFGSVSWTIGGLTQLGDGSQMSDDMISHLEYGARRGWLVVVLDSSLATSDNLYENIPTYINDGNTIVIATEQNIDLGRYKKLPRTIVVERDVAEDFEATVRRAAQIMLVPIS